MDDTKIQALTRDLVEARSEIERLRALLAAGETDLLRRRAELRAALLAEIGMDLARLDHPDQIMQTVGRRIGECLGLSGCLFADVDEPANEVSIHFAWQAGGVPDIRKTFRLENYVTEEFARANRAGEDFVVNDTANDERTDAAGYAALKIGAFVAVPFHSGARWTGYLAATNVAPRDWREDEVRLLRDITGGFFLRMERARTEMALRESEARFKQFADASIGALWIRDAATLNMEYVSPAAWVILGVEPNSLPPDLRAWAAMIVPEDRDATLEKVTQARGGETVAHEFRIQRFDGAFRWIRNVGFPLLDAQGRVQRIGGIFEDVTDAKLAIEHQGVLLAELQHRVRNIMEIIRSIAVRSSEFTGSLHDYVDLLAGRLLALSRVQALLTRAANTGVSLRAIVHDEVSVQSHHEGQYEIVGRDVDLSPKVAEVLTLVIHELATNALKYGALSVANGKVTVSWTIVGQSDPAWVRLEWSEQGAPPRSDYGLYTPRRKGFGTDLIEGRVPYELGGSGRLIIEPGGAKCFLEFPLNQGSSVLETGAPRRASVFGGASYMSKELDLGGRRILVIEDDYFLASDAARALRSAGAHVLGPSATELAAFRELDSQRPDAVLVDINLGVGPSYKIAEALKDRGIPFIFMTGYDQQMIPAEFAKIERLEKPVELRTIVSSIARLLCAVN